MSENLIIKKRIVVKFQLEVLTGLHIGGNKDSYGIGGVDSPVIKNPIDNKPIIPGSSLKGKLRMLLETNSNNFNCDEIFGTTLKPTFSRVIFRDLFLTDESAVKLENKLGKGYYTEVKAENTINRVKVQATPRFIERVPAGAVFEGEYIIQILEGDTQDYKKDLDFAFELLGNSTLGASGTRGYGHVKYIEISCE